MATKRTLLRAGRKHRLAQVTAPAYSLNDLFPDEILSARARGHSQRRRWVARELEMRRNRQSARLPGTNLGDSGAWYPWVLIVALFVGWWEAWAFFASLMLAVYAYFLCSEGRFAAVTGASYAHADCFGYSGKLQIGWGFPFAGIESETVFGEKQSCFFLLDGAVIGDHGWFGGGLGLSRGRGGGWRTIAIESKERN
jgi:hypothetical protein